MKFVLARLQSLKAVALKDGKGNEEANIGKMLALGALVDIQLPEVLAPTDPAPLESGAPATDATPTPPEQVTESPGPEPVPGQPVDGASVAEIPGGAKVPPTPEQVIDSPPGDVAPTPPVELANDTPAEPVTDPQPAPVAVDPVPVADAPPADVPAELAPAPEQVTENPAASADPAPLPEPAPVVEAAPVVGQEAVDQADPGDEDPTPPGSESIESLDKRTDAIEDALGIRKKGGKVSRQ